MDWRKCMSQITAGDLGGVKTTPTPLRLTCALYGVVKFKSDKLFFTLM